MYRFLVGCSLARARAYTLYASVLIIAFPSFSVCVSLSPPAPVTSISHTFSSVLFFFFQITQLKIDNNPFAKGFRDTGAGKREKK